MSPSFAFDSVNAVPPSRRTDRQQAAGRRLLSPDPEIPRSAPRAKDWPGESIEARPNRADAIMVMNFGLVIGVPVSLGASSFLPPRQYRP
jgi:hypothetical protein